MATGGRITVHPNALVEAVEAYQWYRERSVRTAHNFRRELKGALGRLKRNPEASPPYEDETRRLLMRAFPFAVVYRELETHIEILAIAHTRRRPLYWQGRAEPESEVPAPD